jgi:hypothetical protein
MGTWERKPKTAARKGCTAVPVLLAVFSALGVGFRGSVQHRSDGSRWKCGGTWDMARRCPCGVPADPVSRALYGPISSAADALRPLLSSEPRQHRVASLAAARARLSRPHPLVRSGSPSRRLLSRHRTPSPRKNPRVGPRASAVALFPLVTRETRRHGPVGRGEYPVLTTTDWPPLEEREAARPLHNASAVRTAFCGCL